MDNIWVYAYLFVTAIALITEFITSDMVSIWFVGGGLISLVLAIIGATWYVTLPVFIVVSFVLLALFRKFAIRFFSKDKQATNADSAIGKEVFLIDEIAFEKIGSIKLNGVVWSAIAENEQDNISSGKKVKIVGISGNKYIVKEIQ